MTIDVDSPLKPTNVTLRWILDGLDKSKNEEWKELRQTSTLSTVDCHQISGAGFLSEVLKLKMEFENGGSFSAILKAPTNEKLTAKFDDNNKETEHYKFIDELIVAYHNQETRFYELYGNIYHGFPLPQLYAYVPSSIDPVCHGQILLEDVSRLGMLADNRVGLNLEQCKSVVRALTDFHAFTLFMPNSQEIITKMKNKMDAFNEGSLKLGEALQNLDPWFAERRPQIDQLIRENSAQIKDPHKLFGIDAVQAHGDLWGNNIFFKRKPDGTVGDELYTFLDWQLATPGTGLEDMARFICLSANIEVLRDHEDTLLRLYYDGIIAACKREGKPERFTFEKMMEIYKLHRHHEVLFATLILARLTADDRSDEHRQLAVERLKCTYERILSELKSSNHNGKRESKKKLGGFGCRFRRLVQLSSSSKRENLTIESGFYANICHAYHLLRNQGIAAENIILMAVDDIANNDQNKFQGQIFNSPAHKDVYEGCQIDYRGEEVTVANFLSILRGDKTNGKKVLQSNADDHVFVYLTDHGGDGLITFPEFGQGLQLLTTQNLSDSLHHMHDNKMYKEMVIFWEACHSSTMFEGDIYPEDMNIYVMTSAKGIYEKTHEIYFDDKLQVSLSDQFSAAWLEDSENDHTKTRTLKEQFEAVKKRVTNSTVMQFGNLKIGQKPIAQFQGGQLKP